MSKILTICTAISMLAAAPVASETMSRSGRIAFCDKVGTMAELVMVNRQVGTRPGKLIAMFNGDPYQETITTMVRIAYQTPRFSSQEYRDRAAVDFRNDFESECLSSRD